MADKTKTKLTIFANGIQADVYLSDQVKTVRLFSDIREMYENHLVKDNTNKGKETVKWLKTPGVIWQLETKTGRVLDKSKTLAENGIKGGAELTLVQDEKKEVAPQLFEDIVEAIQEYQTKYFAEWGKPDGKRIGMYALNTFSLVLSLMTCIFFMLHSAEISSMLPIIFSGGFTLLGVLGIVFALVKDKPPEITNEHEEQISEQQQPSTAFLGYSFLFTGLTLSSFIFHLPVYMGVALASVIVFFLSLIFIRIFSTMQSTIHYAAFAFSLAIIVVAVVDTAIYFLGKSIGHFTVPITLTVLGIHVAVLGMFVLLFSPKLTRRFAKIALPPVPSAGEDFRDDPRYDISIVDEESAKKISNDTIEGVINQRSGTIRSHFAMIGLNEGGLAVILLGTLLAVCTLDTRPGLVFSFILILGAAIMYRGTSVSGRQLRLLWMYAGIALGVISLIGIVFHPEHWAIFCALVAVGLIVLACLIVYVVVGVPTTNSPITKFYFENVEKVVYGSFIPIYVFMIDLITSIRGS